MAHGDDNDFFERLRKIADDGLGGFVAEMMANPAMREGIGRAGERLIANKKSFDRGVETVLDFTGIPSKRDVRELKSRIDHLSSQLFNLNLKLDRLAEKVAARSRPPRRPRKPRASKASTTQTEGDRVKIVD